MLEDFANNTFQKRPKSMRKYTKSIRKWYQILYMKFRKSRTQCKMKTKIQKFKIETIPRKSYLDLRLKGDLPSLFPQNNFKCLFSRARFNNIISFYLTWMDYLSKILCVRDGRDVKIWTTYIFTFDKNGFSWAQRHRNLLIIGPAGNNRNLWKKCWWQSKIL